MDRATRTTRWLWVRHAPVTANAGRMYGASDPPCDLGDGESFAALARHLPAGAVWVTSHLRRARDTAATIRAAGLEGDSPIVEAAFGEQNFGRWQGTPYDRVEEIPDKPSHRFWFTAPEHRPPDGESVSRADSAGGFGHRAPDGGPCGARRGCGGAWRADPRGHRACARSRRRRRVRLRHRQFVGDAARPGGKPRTGRRLAAALCEPRAALGSLTDRPNWTRQSEFRRRLRA